MAGQTYTGGCCCGALRYRFDPPLTNACYCHCASCRRAVGASPVAWLTVPTAALDLTGTTLRLHRSSAQARRGFCDRCGTAMTYSHSQRPHELDLTIATLDDPSWVTPEYHIWVADRPTGCVIEGELPQYSGWKSDG